jgi:Protein of unknown function (DUF1566)
MKRSKSLLLAAVLVIAMVMLGFGVGRLSAATGTLDSSAPPASTFSYNLADIYNRLISGLAGAQSTFTEPGSSPITGTMHTLNEIMAAAPSVDNANGATKGNVQNGKTFWGLRTDGTWGHMTGTLGVAYVWVPKTAQNQCWDTGGSLITCTGTGQDGDFQKGSTPTLAPLCCGIMYNPFTLPPGTGQRFTDKGNGTVTDDLTALIWLKNANCFGLQPWTSALSDANSLATGTCGLTDGSSAGQWRLPNINELHSLIDLSQSGPAMPSGHPFLGVVTDYYWGSTTYAPNPAYDWLILLTDGGMFYGLKSNTYYVWPVRGGP